MQPNIAECPESLASWFCLNGATCFGVKIQDSVLYNCWCRDGFHGARCDYKYALNRPRQPPHQPEAHLNSTTIASNKSAQDDGIRLDRLTALGLGLVEVPAGQEKNFVANQRASQLRQPHRYSSTNSEYFIVFYYLSLITSVILLVWLILRLFSKVRRQQPNQQPVHETREGPHCNRTRVEANSTRAVSGLETRSTEGQKINHHGAGTGGSIVSSFNSNLHYASGINYQHNSPGWTNYGHANY